MNYQNIAVRANDAAHPWHGICRAIQWSSCSNKKSAFNL